MIRKRIGKTIEFKWTVTTNEENIPFDYPTERDLTVILLDPSGTVVFSKKLKAGEDYEPGTNIAFFTFQGKDQTKLGQYSLEMWENKGQLNQTVVDKINAFELVKHTKDEEDLGCRRY